ncbi:uncharacterized protein [Haliotis cracherodii]|uniref:uncharacterized protein n=1 Tax=Haliotis cracherodii TaxID=6455 RepID=UPI0039EA7DE6
MSTTGDESDVSSTFHSEDEEVQCIFAKTDNYSSMDDDEDTSAVKGTTEQFSKLPPPSLTREERQDVISFVRRKAELCIFPRETRRILCDSDNNVYKWIQLLGDQNASHVFVTQTMSVLPDISCSKSVPRNVMCDICVFYPSKPVMVLTFTTQASYAASQYNSNVAKAVMVYINNDLLENLTVINGVIDRSICTFPEKKFLSRISELETSAKDFAIPNNMKMDEDTALRVLTSFLKMIPKADRIDTGYGSPDSGISSPGSYTGSRISGGCRSKKKSYHSRCIELLHIAQTLGEHVAVYLP